jgi:hypothetical protein
MRHYNAPLRIHLCGRSMPLFMHTLPPQARPSTFTACGAVDGGDVHVTLEADAEPLAAARKDAPPCGVYYFEVCAGGVLGVGCSWQV